MALSIFETAFGKDRTTPPPKSRVGRRRFDYAKGHYVRSGEAQRVKFNDAAARTLVAVQMVCDALIPPSAGRYTVVFGGETAMTERGKRRITVTPQPLYTRGMRLADVADTLTGFTVHEIGHVQISGETDTMLSAWLASEPGYLPWRTSIHAISNVLDDHALEVWAKRRFPGVGHTFRVTTKFVAQAQDMPNRPPFQFNPDALFTERFNLMVCAVRYRWFVRWVSDPATRRERQWWIDWAEHYGDPTDAALRVEGIKVAIARLAINPKHRPPESDPEPEPGKGKGDDAESEDEPETFDTEPDEDKGDDEGDDEGDEGDDEGEGEGEEPGPAGWNDDGTDLKPESKPESKPEPEEERIEGAHLEPDDLGQQGEGSSNPPIFEGFDPERLDYDRIKTVDDYTEERLDYDKYRDRNLQNEVEVEMRVERVTDTHGFGAMKVVINL